MAKIAGYTIQGPPVQEESPPHSLHKSLPIRRDTKGGAPSDLRTLFRHSADYTDFARLEDPASLPNGVPETPKLPPTPPTPPIANGHANEETPDNVPTDSTRTSSKLATPVTPTNQQSPLTPDDTPPRERKLPFLRPFLATQASLVSTRAESFKTAREDVASEDDDGSIFYGHNPNLSTPKLPTLPDHGLNGAYSAGPSGLRRSPISNEVNGDDFGPPAEKQLKPEAPIENEEEPDVAAPKIDVSEPVIKEQREMPNGQSLPQHSILAHATNNKSLLTDAPEPTISEQTKSDNLRRGPSLRDRLEAAEKFSPSASTERFANIIGWTNSVGEENVIMDKRMSGVSTTSTVSAMVFPSSPPPRRRTTLRKVAKTDSLRAASSPLPASKRISTNSSSDSPHQLHHKKARLSNENRLSFGSEPSRSVSLSSAALPKTEIIRVAVIPERTSSLQSSAQSSRRHSLSSHSAKTHSRKVSEDPNKPPSSWQRQRTVSGAHEQAKTPELVPPIQPPDLSLSAATSISESQSQSRTSDHYRSQRKQAETDLRKTLDRMESDRLVSSLRSVQDTGRSSETPTKEPRKASESSTGTVTIGILPAHLHPPTPGTSEWAALRPPSALETPFSQPSYQSASPEINEATAVNLFPHNNTSVQIIEPVLTQESRAVREVRKPEYLKDDAALNQSPLRNPRRPPEPPHFQAQVIPPSPVDPPEQQTDLGMPDRSASMRRPQPPKGGNSFIRTLSRGFSLKNARNKKKNSVDETLSPFWKPKGFWDDVKRDGDMHSDDEDEISRDLDLNEDRGVMNTLGIPQERTVITGPVSLVRRISERRRQNRDRTITKKSSISSLARFRASKRLYRMNILGLNIRLMGLRDMKDHLLYARHRREEERREQRRQELRGKIGNEIVRVADSRFPASDISLNF